MQPRPAPGSQTLDPGIQSLQAFTFPVGKVIRLPLTQALKISRLTKSFGAFVFVNRLALLGNALSSERLGIQPQKRGPFGLTPVAARHQVIDDKLRP